MAFIVLDNAKIRATIERLGYPPAEPGRLHLLGVRGAIPAGASRLATTENRIDLWNDSIGCFGTVLRFFTATTDPGAFYSRNPTNVKGCAHLVNGCWLYQKGLHKKLPALVQAAKVTVRRDRDRDGTAEPGEPYDTGFFGIDVHRGGSARNPVGKWSAGCQVLAREGWGAFWDIIETSPQERFRYYLIDFASLLVT